MANEITLNLDIRFQKGSSDIRLIAADGLNIDVTGSRFIHNRQSIGTTQESLAIGETTPNGGYIVLINRDSTNFVDFAEGAGSAVYTVRLKPGDVACFRLGPSATAPEAKADTAAVELEYLLIEA